MTSLSMSKVIPVHDSVTPGASGSQPLCSAVYCYGRCPTACRGGISGGSDIEVDWSASPAFSDSNQAPDTPILTPLLDFDDGVDVNGSDFDALNSSDLASESALEASRCGIERNDVDQVLLGMSSSRVITTPLLGQAKLAAQSLQWPRLHAPLVLAPPQFGPTIPE